MTELLVEQAAFDGEAATYDASFSHTRLGRWLREAVQTRLVDAFPAGSRVLELACGTGEDAVWLAQRGVHVVATDGSSRMIRVTQTKATAAGVADRVSTAVVRLEDLRQMTSPPSPPLRREGGLTSNINHLSSIFGLPFSGAFSNFGGLNCVADLHPVAQALAGLVEPGGKVILVIMGPWCPWEVVWYLAHGQPRRVVRRWAQGGATAYIGGQTIQVYYPSPQATIRAFAPAFKPVALQGIGTLLPPSYLGGLVDRWPGLFERLAWWEKATAHAWPWTYLNDHYLLELTRTEVTG